MNSAALCGLVFIFADLLCIVLFSVAVYLMLCVFFCLGQWIQIIQIGIVLRPCKYQTMK